MIGDFAKPILMGHYKECNSRHVSHQTLTNSKNQIMTFYMAFFVPMCYSVAKMIFVFMIYDFIFFILFYLITQNS